LTVYLRNSDLQKLQGLAVFSFFHISQSDVVIKMWGQDKAREIFLFEVRAAEQLLDFLIRVECLVHLIRIQEDCILNQKFYVERVVLDPLLKEFNGLVLVSHARVNIRHNLVAITAVDFGFIPNDFFEALDRPFLIFRIGCAGLERSINLPHAIMGREILRVNLHGFLVIFLRLIPVIRTRWIRMDNEPKHVVKLGLNFLQIDFQLSRVLLKHLGGIGCLENLQTFNTQLLGFLKISFVEIMLSDGHYQNLVIGFQLIGFLYQIIVTVEPLHFPRDHSDCDHGLDVHRVSAQNALETFQGKIDIV
jgi:hypothetical protein